MINSNKSFQEPLVSVIMNCYNSEKYLQEAIDSVYAQTYNNWEIIFWDNASTDNSAEISQSYDAKVKYFRGAKTIPLGKARNKALEQCNGKYIAFLDCDDLWVPEKLETQVQLLEDDLTIGLIYTNVKIIFASSRNEKRIEDNKEISTVISFRTLFEDYDITMSSSMIPSSVLFSLDEIFDNTLKHCEEYDLFLRICYTNKVVRMNKFHTVYRIHSAMSTAKNYGLGAIERDYIMSKFINRYIDFEHLYEDLIENEKMAMAWRKFLSSILDNKPVKGRLFIKPFIWNNPGYLLFYLLSFISYKFILSIWNIRMKMKGRIPQYS